LRYKTLGQTRDDAAGEAFDKAAKMLGLGYPGGPAISRLAAKWNIQYPISNIQLPRPMINSKDYDFSFSGLKTAVLYGIKDMELNEKNKINVCAEFQNAVADVLVFKTKKAAENYSAKTVILAGGVSANAYLRKRFKKEFKNYDLEMPLMKFAGDNAAMIALAACRHKNKKSAFKRIPRADGNLVLG